MTLINENKNQEPGWKNYLHSDDNWIGFEISELGDGDLEEVGVSIRPHAVDMINLPLNDELPRANILTVSTEQNLDMFL